MGPGGAEASRGDGRSAPTRQAPSEAIATMSLINDMLRELEARKRAEAGTPDPLAGVAPPPQAPHGRRTVATVLGLLVALGLAAAGAGWYLLHDGALPLPSGPEASVPAGTMPNSSSGAAPGDRVAVEAPEDTGTPAPGGGGETDAAGSSADEDRLRARLSGIEVLPGGHPDRVRIVLRLEGEVPRVNARRTDEGMRLTLDGAAITESLIPPPAGEEITSLALRPRPGGVALEAGTRRPVRHVSLRLEPGEAGAPHRLEVWLRLAPRPAPPQPSATARASRRTAPGPTARRGSDGGEAQERRPPKADAAPAGAKAAGPPRAEPAAAPRMERRVRPPTPTQRAEAAYAQGLAALRVGDLAGARRAFQQAMAAVPGHPKSAEALARLELRAGRREAAEAVLREALARQPGHGALVRLLARIQAQRGALEAAIATLRQALPGGDAALYGLLGALEQRAGRPAQAAQAYRAALARQPREGRWWVGLGIALEHLARHEEARAAYRRARALALDPPLARFVQERLEALE